MKIEKNCESVQNQLLLVADGAILTAAEKRHLQKCAACQEFQAFLDLPEMGVDEMTEPAEKLDQSILNYARQRAGSYQPVMLFSSRFVRFAAAASLVGLLCLAAWMVSRQNVGPDGETAPLTVSVDQEHLWVESDLLESLSETAAVVADASGDDARLESLFATESTAAVADIIEEQLYTLQAEVYFASVSWDM